MASTLVTSAASSANSYIQGAGPVVISQSTALGLGSSTDPGLWYKVHPKVRQMSFAGKILSSEASTATIIQAAFEIQASMDGANRLNTLLGTITCTGTVGIASVSAGVADGLAIDAHWPYVRAVFSSGTTLSSGMTHEVSVASHLIK